MNKRYLSILIMSMLCVIMTTGCGNAEQKNLEELDENDAQNEEAEEPADTEDADADENDGTDSESSKYAIETIYVGIPEYIGIEIDSDDVATGDEELDDETYQKLATDAAWEKIINETTLKAHDDKQFQSLYDSYMDWYQLEADSMDMELEDMVKEFGYASLDEFEQELDENVSYEMKESYVAAAIVDAEELSAENEDELLEQLAEEYGYEDLDEMKLDYSDQELEDVVNISLASDLVGSYCVIIPSNVDDADLSAEPVG